MKFKNVISQEINNSNIAIKKYLKYLSFDKFNKKQLQMLMKAKNFASIHKIIGNDESNSMRIDDIPLLSISSRIKII